MPVSYNGWSASPDLASIGVAPFMAAGVDFPGGVRAGDVATVLRHVLEQFDSRVERLRSDLGCWGANYRPNVNNSSELSCHASGTAVDANAVRHPNGVRGTFTLVQVAEIHRILAEVDGVVRWGGDFTRTPDDMHFEIVGTPAQVTTVARRLTQQPEENEMTPADWDRLDKMLDDKIRLVLRGTNAAGKVTHVDNLTSIRADIASLDVPRKAK